LCAGCGAAARHPGGLSVVRLSRYVPLSQVSLTFEFAREGFCCWGYPLGRIRLFSLGACSSVSTFFESQKEGFRALAGSLRYLGRSRLSSLDFWDRSLGLSGSTRFRIRRRLCVGPFLCRLVCPFGGLVCPFGGRSRRFIGSCAGASRLLKRFSLER
jgi:hypothetical protein